MINIYDYIRQHESLRTYNVDDILFAEFKCPGKKTSGVVWSHHHYFMFVLNGITLLKTPRNEVQLNQENGVFIKRGAIVMERESPKDFCQLMVFVPDDFIRSVINKYKINADNGADRKIYQHVYSLENSEVARSYFHSLLAYFNKPEHPPLALLKVKFEEFIVSLLASQKQNELKKYFQTITISSTPSVREIMDNSFTYNLTIPEFARLCSRSVSTFKTEFRKIYKSTPGKWLQKMRLEYSRYLIDSSGFTFDEICSMSGFDNKARFNRVFKNIYGMTPTQYRMRINPQSD